MLPGRSCVWRLATVARGLATKIAIKDSESYTKSHVKICGWVRAVRKQKELLFINVNDGSCLRNLQVVAPSNQFPEVKGLTVGCSVEVIGSIVESPAAGQRVEMAAKKMKILGECSAKDYPFQARVHHGLDYLRQYPHLRPRSNAFSSLLRVRNVAAMAVHDFFQERGFLLVTTPVLTSSDCEGAGELFSVKPANDTSESKFFGRNTFLTVSGQLHAEAVACAMSSVYTFGPTFRAEKSHTKKHLSEFLMVEAEVVTGDKGLSAILDLVEGLYKHTVDTVLRQSSEEVDLFHKHIASSPDTKMLLEQSLERPFLHVTYSDAINLLVSQKDQFVVKPEWGIDLKTEHEQFIIKHHDNQPVFITDFPAAIKPFYARSTEDSRGTVHSLDLLVPVVGEVAGGTLREERLDVLTRKLEEIGLTEDYQWYRDLRRFGTVPHGGFGMGFERLIQVVLGVDNIRDVTPFPRFLGSCTM